MDQLFLRGFMINCKLDFPPAPISVAPRVFPAGAPGRKPASNANYWLAKLKRNKSRDRKMSRELRKFGWRVPRLWEHELAKENGAAKRIKSSLRKSERMVELSGR